MKAHCSPWWVGGAALLLLGAACGSSTKDKYPGLYVAEPSPTPSVSELTVEQVAPLCTAAFNGNAPVATVKPQTPLVGVRQVDESEVEPKFQDSPSSIHVWRGVRYQYEVGVPETLAAKSPDAAQTIVCTTERQVQVGVYASSGSGAVRVDLDVNVVRRSDGAVLAHKRFTGGDPPESRSTTKGASYTIEYGRHPTDAVTAWLQQLVSS